MRTVTFDVPPQEARTPTHSTHPHYPPPALSLCLSLQILTKDSVTCRVDAVVYFRIADPIKSVVSVENALNSTYLRAQTTLRNILGTKNLKDILSERDIIRTEMSVSWPLSLELIIVPCLINEGVCVCRRCWMRRLIRGE